MMNVPDGTLRENREGPEEDLCGLLMSERSRGRVDRSVRDQDLTSGPASPDYPSITPPHPPRDGISEQFGASMWEWLVLN